MSRVVLTKSCNERMTVGWDHPFNVWTGRIRLKKKKTMRIELSRDEQMTLAKLAFKCSETARECPDEQARWLKISYALDPAKKIL